MTLPAFNVSRMTSTPVLESQNRYAALSIEECNNNDDTPLKGSNNGSPARAEAKAVNPAGHEAESLLTSLSKETNHLTSNLCGETRPANVYDDKSPTIVTLVPSDEAWAKLKHAPCEVSSQEEQVAP
ncbi:uncharacterized protein ARMOST_16974 [Armillaria ostoyae]|uniref:Uncharacterized protein n=1 Tax=Armillaria ostoyae TaxID=47428 RepID=A0A284RXQ7_ARMOS|nr:uncharacterized protein ARMOST_16974 [Armillaria ostoyae]